MVAILQRAVVAPKQAVTQENMNIIDRNNKGSIFVSFFLSGRNAPVRYLLYLSVMKVATQALTNLSMVSQAQKVEAVTFNHMNLNRLG